MVVGLKNAKQYNGRVGVVTKIVYGEPEDKCDIRLENEPADKQIRLRMGYLRPLSNLQLERPPPRAAGPVESEPCPEPPQRLRRGFTQTCPTPAGAVGAFGILVGRHGDQAHGLGLL